MCSCDHRTSLAVSCLVDFKPRVTLEGLGLGHVIEDLIAAPTLYSPVIVVSASASYAKTSVGSTRATHESKVRSIDSSTTDRTSRKTLTYFPRPRWSCRLSSCAQGSLQMFQSSGVPRIWDTLNNSVRSTFYRCSSCGRLSLPTTYPAGIADAGTSSNGEPASTSRIEPAPASARRPAITQPALPALS